MSGPRTMDDLMASARREFPGFELVFKADNRLMRAIDVFLKVASLGTNRDFMRSYYTTIGRTVYLPSSWELAGPENRVVDLRHELVHMRQAARHGRILFSFLYLFFPLPVGLAWFRAKFEKEAYEETLRAKAEIFGAMAVAESDPERIVRQFTTSRYLWMWPFKKSVQKWYQRTLEKVVKETPP